MCNHIFHFLSKEMTVSGIPLHVNKAHVWLWLLSKHCREIILPQSPGLSGQSDEVLGIFTTVGGMGSPPGPTLCLQAQKAVSLHRLSPSKRFDGGRWISSADNVH